MWSPHDSGSVAPQPAALSATLQKLVDDVKRLGRWPKQARTATPEERRLAKRLSDHFSRIPDEIRDELLLLSGAPQPAAPSGSKPTDGVENISGTKAPQRAASEAVVDKLVADLKQFGRIPHRIKNATSAEEHAEDKLAKRFFTNKNSIPDDVLQELEDLGGAHQPAAAASEAAVDKLVADLKQFGRIPHRIKNATSAEEHAEDKLAKRFSANKESIPAGVLQELEDMGGAPQPAASSNDAQEIVDDVKRLGYWPREYKNPSTAEEKQEAQLAQRLRKTLKRTIEESSPQTRLQAQRLLAKVQDKEPP